MSPRCAAPLCGTIVHTQSHCPMHGGEDRHKSAARPGSTLPTNPWADHSPDCPRGHHARRVYRWAYDPPSPAWYCGACHLLFDTEDSP